MVSVCVSTDGFHYYLTQEYFAFHISYFNILLFFKMVQLPFLRSSVDYGSADTCISQVEGDSLKQIDSGAKATFQPLLIDFPRFYGLDNGAIKPTEMEVIITSSRPSDGEIIRV